MKTCRRDVAALQALVPTWGSARSSLSATRELAAPAAVGAAMIAATFGVASGQIGTNYCTAAPNSTGVAASISGSGSASVQVNNLILTGTNLTQNAAAYFLCSRTQGFVMNPAGSAGNLCVGNLIGRVVGGTVQNSGSTGIVNVTADWTAMPQPSGPVFAQAGETWNFQCWYRDVGVGGGSTSNFTDGLEVLCTGVVGPIPGMVPIPAGTFLMGSTAPTSAPYFNGPIQQPVHQVTISYPFWMGQHEVTQSAYQALMATNPSSFQGASKPVNSLDWTRSRQYCAALNAQQAGYIPAGYEYRLPTEAEWEYACRAGTTSEFHYGQALLCNEARFFHSFHSNSSCGLNSQSGPVNVGTYAPNPFGLYDMHGNVWEWCLDSYAPYSSASVTDPFVTGGEYRICRGGSWHAESAYCRSAIRNYANPNFFADSNYGFRVVLAPILVP